ncbi:hypothetical protein GGX14DRAFT_576355 [Mycena pura]|uniref:Uncharacterized protein n=1 Tax=Mycena pura TaxID=153505 RepID=A0AAD6UTL7_9AGAR|nr:hypothetical protein GGX14DRAFT_576355 [Mycena pura]
MVFGRDFSDFNFPPPAVPPRASASAPPKTAPHAKRPQPVHPVLWPWWHGALWHTVAAAAPHAMISLPQTQTSATVACHRPRRKAGVAGHRDTNPERRRLDLTPPPAAADRDYVDMAPGHLPTTTDTEPAAAGHGDPGHTVAATFRRALSIKSFRAAARQGHGAAREGRERPAPSVRRPRAGVLVHGFHA